MYARGMLIRQVLRGIVILKLRIRCVPLPVGYSWLKTDDTSILENHLPRPPSAHLSLAPSCKPYTHN